MLQREQDTYVGGSGDGQALGTVLEREDLARDDPGERAPGGSEEENVDADKGDASLLGVRVVDDDLALVILARRQGSEHRDEELADGHADGTAKKEKAAAPPVDSPESREGRDDVDDRSNHLDDEGLAETRVLKVLGAVVEDEVDASQLLQSLEAHARKLALEHGAAEAVDVAGGSDAHLVVVVGLDLGNLVVDGGVVRRQATELAQSGLGAVELTLLDEETRGLGQDKHADDEDDGPGELHGDGDAVRARVVVQMRCVVNHSCEQQTDGDGQLVGADDGTADPLRSRLGLVQRDQSGDQTNTETGEEAASKEERQGGGGSLEDDAKVENPGGGDQGPAATDGVGEKGREEGTEEGAGRENRHDSGLLRGRDAGVAVGIHVARRELFFPEVHSEDAANGARVVAEQDTAKGDKGADHNGGPGRAGLILGPPHYAASHSVCVGVGGDKSRRCDMTRTIRRSRHDCPSGLGMGCWEPGMGFRGGPGDLFVSDLGTQRRMW